MSTTMNSTIPISDVLSTLNFQKLSNEVSFYKPTIHEKPEQDEITDPSLIILCSWAFAQPRHIAKYIAPYQEVYPAASILLVQIAVANAIWRPDAWQHSYFQPAVTAIQRHISRTRHTRVLVHAFSNGGSHSAVQLSQMFRELCGGLKMPVGALILDSTPGLPRFGPTIKALTLGVPGKNSLIRTAATLFAYCSVALTAALDVLNIAEPAATKVYRVLNDPYDVFLLNNGKPVPRSYIYSNSDEMIMEEDVLQHAHTAKRRLEELGVNRDEIDEYVQLAEFSETAHVNHIKNDQDRYWNLVRTTWQLAGQPSG